jgi:hypothetical protein
MHDNSKLSRDGNRSTLEVQPLTQLQPQVLRLHSVLALVLVKRTVAAS